MAFYSHVGLTSSQVVLSCTNFCLLGKATCTCTVTGTVLGWSVSTNLNTLLGLLNLERDNLNMPTTLFQLPTFDVLLIDNSNETLTATLSFTTLPEYQGYIIGCDTTGETQTVIPIHIPGINCNHHLHPFKKF